MSVNAAPESIKSAPNLGIVTLAATYAESINPCILAESNLPVGLVVNALTVRMSAESVPSIRVIVLPLVAV